LNLGALPGTLAEAKAIIKLFGDEAATSAGVLLLSGPQATKERVRASLTGKRYVHLATHGYFASPEFAFYPGLLSGLIFAGANQPPKDAVTGLVDFGSAVMTAEEIEGLDLSACDLAVLSACETGRGAVAGGEGVLGLQRAFHQAGARTVIASLWTIGDEPTRALMARFYENLWQKGQLPATALRAAQLSMLRGELVPAPSQSDGSRGLRRSAGPQDYRKPYYWAAFVLSTNHIPAPTGPPSAARPVE
jgi:CHAT domain-containing protein